MTPWGALWAQFAERECGTYSPLYAAIAWAVADDGDLLDLVVEVPPAAHLPNVLLAAVHYLLLGGLSHPRRPPSFPRIRGHS